MSFFRGSSMDHESLGGFAMRCCGKYIKNKSWIKKGEAFIDGKPIAHHSKNHDNKLCAYSSKLDRCWEAIPIWIYKMIKSTSESQFHSFLEVGFPDEISMFAR